MHLPRVQILLLTDHLRMVLEFRPERLGLLRLLFQCLLNGFSVRPFASSRNRKTCTRDWPDHTCMSSINSDAGATLVTSKWSLARVQAT